MTQATIMYWLRDAAAVLIGIGAWIWMVRVAIAALESCLSRASTED